MTLLKDTLLYFNDGNNCITNLLGPKYNPPPGGPSVIWPKGALGPSEFNT